MTQSSGSSIQSPHQSLPTLAELAEQSQIDFELDFFSKILDTYPDYVEVLKVMGNNFTLKGKIELGLEIDQRLVKIRPQDHLAHYNLACSHALLHHVDKALQSLQKAVQLGYRDFNYMEQDRDLDSIREDPRYREIIREYKNK